MGLFGKKPSEIEKNLERYYAEQEKKAETVIMYCQKCGGEVEEDDIYCCSCGTDTDKFPPINEKPDIAKEKINQTFSATYLAIYESTKDTIIENCSVELLPFLYVVSDIAAVNTEYDRRKMKELIFSQFYRLLGDDARTDISLDVWFDSRIELYGEAVRGHDLIGLFFPRNSDVWKKGSAIVRCSVMLGDILLCDDIETIEDYEKAPIRLCNISDVIEGSKLIMDIARAATLYHNALYRILKKYK